MNKQKRHTEIHPEANSDEDQLKEVDKDLESNIDVLESQVRLFPSLSC